MKKLVSTLIMTAFVFGCTPEVGSKKWCEQLSEKPKGEWTMNETKDYASHCIFKSDEE